MTCKDCIHYDACKDIFLQLGKKEEAQYMDTNGDRGAENECKQFREKSRFVELPCNVGDPVYQVDTTGRIYESKVSEIIYACSGFAFDKSAIGKRVFLTYEEAEKKAKEREENAEVH